MNDVLQHGNNLSRLWILVLILPERASVALFLLMLLFTQGGWQSIEERMKTVLFFTETRSVLVTQRLFLVHFHTRLAPSFKIIHKHCNNDGSVLERKRRRPASVPSPENISAVWVALQRSPSKSTWKFAVQLGMSRRSVQRILKSDLNFYPYKMTVLPILTVQNKN
jgi:hypothetical protein